MEIKATEWLVKEGVIVLSEEQRTQKRLNILQCCFELFVQQGLENTSVNDLAKYCKTYKAALYEYFSSKDEIVLEAAKMYLMNLNEKINEFITGKLGSINEVFKQSYDFLVGEKNELRFIYQVISSPKYGDESREKLEKIYVDYLNYSKVIAKVYNIPHERFRPYFLLFIATIHDFCLWESSNFAEEKLTFIYQGIEKIVESKGGQS